MIKYWREINIPKIKEYTTSIIELNIQCKKLLKSYPEDQVNNYKKKVIENINQKNGISTKKGLAFILFPNIGKFSSLPRIKKNNLTGKIDIAGCEIKIGEEKIEIEPDNKSMRYSNSPNIENDFNNEFARVKNPKII